MESGRSQRIFHFFALSLTAAGVFAFSYSISVAQNLPPSVAERNDLWGFNTGNVVYSSPAIADDGTIYVGSENNKLYAINPNGTQKWAFTTGDWVDSSPAIGPDGTIYVGSWDNKLYAISPAGIKLWEFQTESLIISSPAVAPDGTIYFGSSDMVFYALTPAGTLKWEFETVGEIDSSPAIGLDGTVYFGAYDGLLYALNPEGSLKWQFAVHTFEDRDERIVSSPAIDAEGNVYFGSSNHRFYSLDPNGQLRWFVEVEDRVDTSPAIASDGTVYFASRDGYLYGADNIGINLEFFIGDVFYSSPAIDSEGNVYIASFVGAGASKLYAIEPAWADQGRALWQFTVSGLIDSSPSIGEDGVIYIGAFDGRLYAINANGTLDSSAWPQFSRNAKHTGSVSSVSLPIIMWSDPAPISYGTPLSAAQLNATANVPGSFTYNPDFGAVLNASSSPINLSVTFTPTDTGAYLSADALVAIDILKANQTVAFNLIGDLVLGEPAVALSASASSGLAVGYSLLSGSASLDGSTIAGTAEGQGTVRASQPGNGDFNAALPVDADFTVVTYADYWIDESFTTEEANDPEISGDFIDYDGDGTPNLLEYAFLLDPKIKDQINAPAPVVDESGCLVFEFPRNPRAVDLNFRVEATGDFLNWDSLAEISAGGQPTGTGFIEEVSDGMILRVSVKDTVSAGAASSRVIRVVVTRP